MGYGLEAIIIDADTKSRMLLKQAAMGSGSLFKKVYQSSDLNSALRQMDSLENKVDVCFIGASLKEQLGGIIKSVKNHMIGELAAMIMVAENQEHVNAMLARNVILGMDGFLLEPYSVDALTSICELAVKIRKSRVKEKQKVALRIIIDEIMVQLNNAAQLKAAGFGCEPVFKILRDIGSIIKDLEEEVRTIYFDEIIEKTQESVPTQIIAYNGASERIRRKMLAKVRADAARLTGLPELSYLKERTA